MEKEGLQAICDSAQKKLDFFSSPTRYFVYSCMAGGFCSLGMALAYTLGAGFFASEALRGAYKLIIGAAFSMSFTMIVFAGAELFTGNVMVMTVAVLSKKVRLSQAFSLLAFCYAANFFGAAVFGALFAGTGLLDSFVGEFLVTSTAAKMSLDFWPAFFCGVLCNTMVCLGVWSYSKAKSETARMILLFWVVLCFAGTGYEHSVANAGLFTMAFFAPNADGVSLLGAVKNLVPVTLGNIAGGALLVGWVYWFSGRERKKPDDSLPVK